MTTDFKPIEAIGGDFSCGMMIVADHAMRHMPDEYGRLGLPDHEFDRHIAYGTLFAAADRSEPGRG